MLPSGSYEEGETENLNSVRVSPADGIAEKLATGRAFGPLS